MPETALVFAIAVIVTGGIAAIALFLHDNRRTR